MSNTLEGFFASDFVQADDPPVTSSDLAFVNNPPLTLAFGERDLGDGSVRTVHAFSMPSDKSTLEVWKAYVANQSASAVTGLSLVVRDDVNDSVIHSTSSAQIQEGSSSALSSGGSADTRVVVNAKNESGGALTNPSGLVAIRLV